jgi:hypothetical protein
MYMQHSCALDFIGYNHVGKEVWETVHSSCGLWNQNVSVDSSVGKNIHLAVRTWYVLGVRHADPIGDHIPIDHFD